MEYNNQAEIIRKKLHKEFDFKGILDRSNTLAHIKALEEKLYYKLSEYYIEHIPDIKEITFEKYYREELMYIIEHSSYIAYPLTKKTKIKTISYISQLELLLFNDLEKRKFTYANQAGKIRNILRKKFNLSKISNKLETLNYISELEEKLFHLMLEKIRKKYPNITIFEIEKQYVKKISEIIRNSCLKFEFDYLKIPSSTSFSHKLLCLFIYPLHIVIHNISNFMMFFYDIFFNERHESAKSYSNLVLDFDINKKTSINIFLYSINLIDSINDISPQFVFSKDNNINIDFYYNGECELIRKKLNIDINFKKVEVLEKIVEFERDLYKYYFLEYKNNKIVIENIIGNIIKRSLCTFSFWKKKINIKKYVYNQLKQIGTKSNVKSFGCSLDWSAGINKYSFKNKIRFIDWYCIYPNFLTWLQRNFEWNFFCIFINFFPNAKDDLKEKAIKNDDFAKIFLDLL